MNDVTQYDTDMKCALRDIIKVWILWTFSMQYESYHIQLGHQRDFFLRFLPIAQSCNTESMILI